MIDLETVLAVEGEAESEEAHYAAIQKMVNAGQWSFQGSFGRTMMVAIESGYVMLGEKGARDYWGNYIPSRSQVKAGTKGSYEFVAEAMGVEWADMMKAVQ